MKLLARALSAVILCGAALATVARAEPAQPDAKATSGKTASEKAASHGPVARVKPNIHGEAPSLPPAAHPSERALGETLRSKRYEFCHDAKYPLTADEVRWCALLPRPADTRAARCADFARACEAGATAKLVPPSKPINLKLPGFGGLGRVVFYTLIAGTVGALLFLLLRGLVGRRTREAPAQEAEGEGARDAAAVAEQAAAVERDVNRLLARARALAAAGDYLAAVGDLHAALLRRLEGDGHIRIHRAATNGDYVRELRARAPALAAPVGEVTGAVESIQFGVAPAGTLYQALLERVTALLEVSPRVVAVLAFFVLATVAASCDNMRSDWRDSPSGSAAVSAFLTASGIDTKERLRPLAELDSAKEAAEAHDQPATDSDKAGEGAGQSKDDSADAKARASLLPRPPHTLVILPDAQVGDADWAAVKAAAERRDLTIVVTGPRRLPAWILAELVNEGAAGAIHVTRELERWREADLQADGDELPGKAARAAERAELQLTAVVPGEAWVNVGTPHQVLLRRGGKAYAVAMELEQASGQAHTTVVVIADGELFTNASLAVADNGAVLHVLASAVRGPIQLVTQETGLVATTPLDSVSRGRLAPFMLQLCAFLILFFVLKGAAFGKLMDRQVIRRRRFSEHIEALGLQYARARAGRHVATAYATWTVERLRERMPGDRGLGELSAAIAARTGKPLGEVARLLFHAHHDEAADAEPRTRAAAEESLQTLRALAALLAPVGGRTTTNQPRQGETKS
jgi:hypothetical protein